MIATKSDHERRQGRAVPWGTAAGPPRPAPKGRRASHERRRDRRRRRLLSSISPTSSTAMARTSSSATSRPRRPRRVPHPPRPERLGKSTLLRIVAGLEDPDSVERHGAPWPRHRRPAAQPPQRLDRLSSTTRSFPHMMNVEYGLKVRKVPPATRRARPRQRSPVRLPGRKYDRRIHQLGGERQRRARPLARPPARRPPPRRAGALDERLRLDMQVELIDIRRKTGGTFILVTHSQEEADHHERPHRPHARRHHRAGSPTEDAVREPAHGFRGALHGRRERARGPPESVAGDRATVRRRHVFHGRPVGDRRSGPERACSPPSAPSTCVSPNRARRAEPLRRHARDGDLQGKVP